ncbi:MAG: hypothetical protein WCP79_14005 [Bacillota bacterium]
MKRIRDSIVDELHKIREDNYNATKDLSDAETIKRTNSVAHELAKIYGFKCISSDYSEKSSSAA